MARFGFLLVALCFQPHVRADDVDSDVLSLLQMRAVVEDDQNNSVACHCTTPGQGTSGKNKYECNNGNSGYCASNQVCYADGNFNYGDWGAACALPTCKCVTPNAGTAGHNQYTCNDGTSAFCSSNQECYATGAFQKGNWQLGCQVTCSCNKDGTLHHVPSCTVCGDNWCDSALYSKDEPDVEASYSTGANVYDWGCHGGTPILVRNSGTGAIYVVQPVGQVLHHVTECDQCGKSWCDSPTWLQSGPDVENGYETGSSLSEFGCDNVPEKPTIIHNSQNGAIYFVQAAPPGSYTCSGGQTGSCASSCSASSPFLLDDVEEGCPTDPSGKVLHHVTDCEQCGHSWCESSTWLQNGPDVEYGYENGSSLPEFGCENVPEHPTIIHNSQSGAVYFVQGAPDTTTTTTAPAGPCQSFCNSKKHASQPWIGGKCSWQNCTGCSPCDQ